MFGSALIVNERLTATGFAWLPSIDAWFSATASLSDAGVWFNVSVNVATPLAFVVAVADCEPIVSFNDTPETPVFVIVSVSVAVYWFEQLKSVFEVVES